MATLMLSSLGSAVAGPLGAAVGGLLGQAVDRSIFGSAVRRGPRLDDLRLQTSSYGSMVPRIYGTMRAAGTVIWATDLKEGTELESGGKGQPDALSYSYSASFAVALSSRPIVGIRRIWADGQLLRGAAGDFKVKTKFRLYTGQEDQPCDPLIASVEGIENTPAFRGLALAVFENLQLASFGNRIPMLTFEVVADDGEVELGTILNDVSSGVIEAQDRRQVDGYAAYGDTARDACQPLISIFDVGLRERGLALVAERGTGARISAQEMGCSADAMSVPRIERTHRAAAVLPDAVHVSFYDESRDYQTGEQHAAGGEQVRNRQRLELPAVIPASAAKSLASEKLARLWTQRETVRLRLPPAWLTLAQGDLLRFPGSNDAWRVTKIEVEGLVVVADLVRKSGSDATFDADPGRSVVGADQVARPLVPLLLEIPGQEIATGLRMYLAASGGPTPWRSVPVLVSSAGSEFVTLSARKRAVVGKVNQALGAANSCLLDLVNSVEIQLSHEENWLRSCEDADLAAGANLAALGPEIIQFGNAVALGEGRFRISRLLRGRGGSEWACSGHAAGEAFVLLDPNSLARIDLPQPALNSSVVATGLGLGDEDLPGRVEKTATGESLRPPSPVHLHAVRGADGSLMIRWVRRSRLGWNWGDEVETPLGESKEQYRVRLIGLDSFLERSTTEPSCRITESEIRALGVGAVRIAVTQVGDFAMSRETMMELGEIK